MTFCLLINVIKVFHFRWYYTDKKDDSRVPLQLVLRRLEMCSTTGGITYIRNLIHVLHYRWYRYALKKNLRDYLRIFPNSQNFCKLTKYFLVCQIHSEVLKHVLQKNYVIIWEFFPNGGPPPLLGTPYSKKKFIVYFAF